MITLYKNNDKNMISFNKYSCSLNTVLILFLCCSNSNSNFKTIVQGFDSLLQLPRSGSVTTQLKSKRVFRVTDFGAKGDAFTDDTQAFKNAWERACSLSRRTTVIVPEGNTYLLRPINFSGHCKSKITLRIEGTILAPKDPDVWDGLNSRRWLYFHQVSHLTVVGGGLIDGMGYEWWDRSCKINETNPCRHAPTAITFHRCKYLKVENVMVVNSQQMHMAFTNCLRVAIGGVRIIAPAYSPNTDGIHISASHGVVIKNSIIGTGDDCISIVNNSSQIRIQNIVCGPGHGISIGSLGDSDSWSQVQDVVVDGAVLTNADNGVRIKTWQGGSGFASDITFKNIIMENVFHPIIIDQYYCDSPTPCPNKTMAVRLENISFINIKGTSASKQAMQFACSDDFPCRGLYLEDINLVSYSGRFMTTSFCWQAYGTSLGYVYPTPCFSDNDIQQKGVAEYDFHSSKR